MANTHSIDLESASSQYLNITSENYTGLALTNNFTIEMWVKVETLATMVAMVKQEITGGDGDMNYRIILFSTGMVGFVIQHSGGYYDLNIADIITAGVWTHLAFVKRSSGTGMEIYANGVSVGTGGGTNNAITTTDPLYIGCRFRSSAELFFDGLIDEIRIWNDVRTVTEISDNYQKELAGTEDNLVAYWKVNDSLLDETSNDNDLTNNNSAEFSTDVPFVEATEVDVSDSGAGSENVLVNKDILLSEAGTGTENILVSKELILTPEAGVGAEIVTITVTASKDIADSGVGSDDVEVSKAPALVEKHILIKVYDSDGNYVATWDDATFEGFTKEINGGLGECQIKLGRKFDNYGEYFDVSLNNEVRILVTDRDTRNTDDEYVLVYSGYISKYTPWIVGGKEGVIVHCLGYYTKLANDIYKNGTTTTIQESATDVGTIFRNLMDRYVAETTNQKLHYSLASILTTSTTATYLFEMMSYREAIEVIKSLAPTDWWWYVDQYHQVNFKSKPTATDHTFVFGRHFHSVKVEKSMEKIKNALLFWNREIGDNKIYKLYSDPVSIGDHGRRVIKHIDQNRVGTTIDADKIGDAFVAEHKEPDIKVIVEIIDNAENLYKGYDIESIEPGQTCIFSGFSEALSETFKENMLITKVEYTLEKVRLTIEPTIAGIVDRLEHVAKQVSASNTKNAPTNYST